jgi:BCD family chlorophyll transporter-like MFS transporter
MVACGLAFGVLLADFSQLRLVQVVQGAAMVTMALNIFALWKQEPRAPSSTAGGTPRPPFGATWQRFAAHGKARRFLVAVGVGTAAFNMQDIILEPYGGEILHLGVGATTTLTALMAIGALTAFALSARMLTRGADAYRIAAFGALAGLVAFSAVIFAEPLASPTLFRIGATLIGFGGGLFSVATLSAAMNLDSRGQSGLALGAWGAVQASAAGLAIACGGALRDAVSGLAAQGALGPALTGPSVGYSFVYHLEIGLLFATLIAIGPLVRSAPQESRAPATGRFGLAEFPG